MASSKPGIGPALAIERATLAISRNWNTARPARTPKPRPLLTNASPRAITVMMPRRPSVLAASGRFGLSVPMAATLSTDTPTRR